MPKEAVQKHDQGPLSQAILDLEAKNREFNGMLFSTFGSGRHKALVFPTPLPKEIDNRFDKFLVITPDGRKAIQVNTIEGNSTPSADAIRNLINARLGKKTVFLAWTGYRKRSDGEVLNMGGGFFITQNKSEKFSRDKLRFESDSNCRLVEFDSDQVEKILQLNIERAQGLQSTSQKISGALGKAS